MNNTPFVPSYFGEDAPSFLSSINPNLAGKWLDSSSIPNFRHGVGGAMEQPDNSGFLPGATTTLPPSPYQTPTQGTLGSQTGLTDLDKLLRYLEGRDERSRAASREEADYYFDKRREEAERANRMGQWNTIMGSVLKDLPRTLSEQYRRRNMYIGDMLRMQQEQARERSAGIRQSLASMPGMTNPPTRNYIQF